MNTQLVRIRTRKLALLASFRASHDNVDIGNISAFTKKFEESSSEWRRLPQSLSGSTTRHFLVAKSLHSLNIDAAEETLQEVSGSLHLTDSPLLPFTSRLGERPLSTLQREQRKNIRIQVPSVGESHRVQPDLDVHQQQPSSTRRDQVTGAVPRPQTAPRISKSNDMLEYLQSRRKQTVASPSRAIPARPGTVAGTLRHRSLKNVRAQVSHEQVTDVSSENAAFDVEGVELEVLLKKQLQLVSHV